MASIISNKDIERLEKVKQLLQDIKEIDSSFKLSNVIEADEDTILIFNCSAIFKRQDLNDMKEELEKEFGHKCIILNNSIELDKAIRIDYAKGIDYTTTTYYDGQGNPVKEETTQYK